MELDEALRELKRELEALYGDRLKGVYLFGSEARGEAEPDSDVDVAIVLDDYESVWAEIHRISDAATRISLRADRHFTETPVRQSEWAEPNSLFLRAIRRDAKAVS